MQMAFAYLDTLSGIAGDMLLAALVDAGADPSYIIEQLRSLPGLEQVELEFSATKRHDFRALRLDVRHPLDQAHRRLSDIEAMIASSRLTDHQRDLALRVFRRLGDAEAKVHGTTIEQVHFHEVGAIDSIVDIVGVAIALSQLQIRRIVAAPPPTGTGTIRIAHGLVSVPAPATAELLRGIPLRGSSIAAELTTPTGAAVLATLVDGFGPMPDMQIDRIGCGAGHRELKEQANILRVIVGSSPSLVGTATDGSAEQQTSDEVILLETNIDDASGQQLGYAIEQIWSIAPLDVYTTAIAMKKNRPGILLSVLCRPEQRHAMEQTMLRHTGSLGIRQSQLTRCIVPRESFEISTPLGTAHVKVSWLPGGDAQSEMRIAPEYEDCRRLAQASGQTLESVMQVVRRAAQQELDQRSLPSSRTAANVNHESPSPISDPSHSHDHHDHHDHHHH